MCTHRAGTLTLQECKKVKKLTHVAEDNSLLLVWQPSYDVFLEREKKKEKCRAIVLELPHYKAHLCMPRHWKVIIKAHIFSPAC